MIEKKKVLFQGSKHDAEAPGPKTADLKERVHERAQGVWIIAHIKGSRCRVQGPRINSRPKRQDARLKTIRWEARGKRPGLWESECGAQ